MKLSLNGARLGANGLSFVEFADLAARHGFEGVDFGVGGAMKAAEELGGVQALRDALAAKNVAPAVFGLDVEWRKDEATFRDGLDALKPKAAFARELGSERCTTWMLPATDDDPKAWVERTAKRFREIGRVLEDNGVRLGIEWVGPHHLRAGGANATGANNAVYTMDGALALAETTAVPSIGLLVDCYHCFTTGAGEAEIARLTDAQIVHVHVNDAPKGATPETAKDGERVLPGEGVIDLAGFLRGLRATGYSGYIACEVLAPQNIADDPETAAAKVRESLRNIGL